MCGRLDSSIVLSLVILASSSLPRSNAILAFISLLRKDDKLLPNSVWYLMMPLACATMSLILFLHIVYLNCVFRRQSSGHRTGSYWLFRNSSLDRSLDSDTPHPQTYRIE